MTVDIRNIPQADLETLKSSGYSEDDLSMLAQSEIDTLLPPKEGSNDDGAGNPGTGEGGEGSGAAGAASEGASDGAGGVEAPPEEPDTTAFVPQYKVEVPADAKASIDALKTEEKEAFKRLMDGEIDADEYQTIKDRTQAESDAIKEKVLQARIFEDANKQAVEQQAEREWKRAENSAMASFKDEGIDYKGKPSLLAAYNVNLKALAADPKNNARDAAWFLSEAHKLTKADLGIATAPRKQATVSGMTGVDPAEIPPTLRGVPAAGANAVNSDEFAHMRNLDGLELERAHAKLTPEQRDRWMAS